MGLGYIFLSYSRRDGSQYVERLEKDLMAAGYQTWRDRRSLNEYNDFSAEIENGIRSASCVAVCVTPSVEQNPHSFVRREIIYAQTKKKPIIPLVFPQADIPVLINHLTWIPFFEGTQLSYKSGFNELLKRLQESPKSSTLRLGVDDPFRDYLTQLYEWIVAYLDQSVFSLIALGTASVADAIEAAASPVLPSFFLKAFALSAGLGEKKQPDPSVSYRTFPEAVDAYEGRVLLLGEPGSGKTTTLMSFARGAIIRRLEDPQAPLPLLAPVSTWDAYVQPEIAEWLSDSVPSMKQDVLQAIQAGEALLLLDGLDELGRERPVDPARNDGEMFDPRLRFIQRIPPQNQVVLTCRVNDYLAIGEKVTLTGAVRLQKLDDSLIGDFLKDQPDLWAILQRDEQLKELTRTPLLLSLLTFAFADSSGDLDALKGLRTAELSDRIFDTYLRRRYEHEKRKPFSDLPYTYDKMIAVLRCAARMDIMGESQNRVGHFYLSQCLGYEPEVFIEQVSRLHILVLGPDPRAYRFMHLLLRDFLAFPDLLRSLDSEKDWWRRRKATTLLGDLRDPRAVKPLSDVLLKDQDENIRSAAADALGKIGDPSAVPALIQALDDTYARVRGPAAQALAAIGDGRALSGLLTLTRDGDWIIKQIAIDAISKARDPQAIPVLVKALDSMNPAVASAASAALAQIGQSAVVALFDALQSSRINVRTQAIITLGNMQAVAAVPHLIKLLDDETPISFIQRICDVAATALGHIGTLEARSALETFSKKK